METEKKFKLVDGEGNEIDISCLHLNTHTKYLFLANIQGLSDENAKIYLDGLQNAIASLLGERETFLVVPCLGSVGDIKKIEI